jgi:cob(I)alamin adenosyltransferase
MILNKIKPSIKYFKSLNSITTLNFTKTAFKMNNNDSTTNKQTHIPKIYTKTGDKGTSSLFTGERRRKDDQIFNALGDTDELNSILGLARQYCLESSHDFNDRLTKIQSTLLDIGSFIATPKTSATENQLARLSTFPSSLVEELEKWIDEYQEQLPPLKNFILPSGGKTAATLHLARSVCRRLERSLPQFVNDGNLDHIVAVYINRLSDFLFVLARYACLKEHKEEVIYKKPK